ncbi:MAG: hypothetical protein BWY15_00821 [Firmicutes bacterium ADurb.Bin193]|nr:MAG: hypothetical protein BWY15_00821 [Firmicutes bacterium ADurb.Bin193]
MRQDLYQYERYKARLGDDAPRSFRAFRQLKKTGGEAWGILEAQHKGMGYYEKALKNEPAITKTVVDVAEKVGTEPAGLEFRIKSKESYLRKIKSNYRPDGNEYEIKDILRYTYISPPETLTGKTIKSIDEFDKMGYNTIGVKNSWLRDYDPYNGINTIITAPNGQKFEMQYHTPESFALKNGALHKLYEKQRLIKDDEHPEYTRLQKEMFELSKGLEKPNNIEKVKDKK